MVESRLQTLRHKVIQQWAAVLVFRADAVTAGVAARALIDLSATAEFPKINQQPDITIGGLRCARLVLSPTDMTFTWSMTGFALQTRKRCA